MSDILCKWLNEDVGLSKKIGKSDLNQERCGAFHLRMSKSVELRNVFEYAPSFLNSGVL